MTQDDDEFGAPAKAASLVRSALERACPGSVTRLRGSLAAGRADAYSDMDIEWRVPADRFAVCVREPGTVLREAARALREVYGDAWPRRRAPTTAHARAASTGPAYASTGPAHACAVRTDPEYAHSPGARLLFVRFPGLPLFWRLDLMVLAEGGTAAGEGTEPGEGRDAPEADWSLPASALENAIAAVKALARADPETAAGLLSRGLARLGERPGTRTGDGPGDGGEGQYGGQAGDWPAAVSVLVRAAVRAEPGLAELGAQTEHVARRLLPPGPGDGHPGAAAPLRWLPAATDGSPGGPGADGT
ncbi:hypothetical protein AB0J21_31985 [Streptomyces sp. NPDC049954]|uniref:hypothetical protein n=1 Tax=Streptomyces sp. NPDC049954 TaxID=3155779 RepID=UPI00343983B7